MSDMSNTLTGAVYNLSPLDIIGSHLYISNCFFFENRSRKGGVELEHHLYQGLCRALQQFPILVGELQHSGVNTMSVVVRPERPNMPTWETNTSKASFKTLQQSHFHYNQWPPELKVQNPLLEIDTKIPSKLIRLQICHFSDNAGVAILVRIAHALFDAKGVVMFINHWAQCCRNLKSTEVASLPESVAILRRDVMYQRLPPRVRPRPLPLWLYPVYLLLALLLNIMALFLKKNLTFGNSESHLFVIARKKLDSARNEARRLGSTVSDNDLIVSLFSMAYAQSTSAYTKSTKVNAIIPCDFRHRLGIPEAYVGNCAVGLFLAVSATHLFKPICNTSLIKVAVECRKTVDSADRGTIEKRIKGAMQSIRLLGNNARVLYSLMVCQAFSSQSRLPFYSIDFGFGQPLLAVPVAYPRTVAVVVPSPPTSDDVYVWLSLQCSQMIRLLQNKGFRSFVDVKY